MLEDKTGTVLVLRGSPCRATETGLRLYRHAEEVERLEATLAKDLGDGPEGPRTVRIAANADSLATWLVPALAETENCLFELIVDDQDHSADLLRRGEVAAAITSNGKPVQGCDTYALGSLRYIATASPHFAQHWFPEGPDAETLSHAPALVYDDKDRLQASWAARVAGRSVRLPRHRIPSTTGFVTAARRGLGWGMNPASLVARAISRGRLVDLSPGAPLDTPLYWQCSRIGKDALAPLTRAVRAAAKGALVQVEDEVGEAMSA